MKKLLLIVVAFVFVTSMFSFKINKDKFNASMILIDGDEAYCVEITCKEDPNCQNSCVWLPPSKIVIYAFNASEARIKAQNLHPGCKVGAPWKGTCK